MKRKSNSDLVAIGGLILGAFTIACTPASLAKRVRDPVQAADVYRRANPRQQDFLYVASVLEDAFPGPLNRLVPRATYDSLKRASIERLRTPMGTAEFRMLLERFLALAGSGHTNVNGALYSAASSVFPFTLIVTDSVYIRAIDRHFDATIPGAVVLAVNGHPIGDVFAETRSIVPADNAYSARITTAQRLWLPQWVMSAGLASQTDSLALLIQSPRDTVRTVVLHAMPTTEIRWQYPAPSLFATGGPYEAGPPSRPPNGASPFWYRILPNRKVAYLRTRTFLDRTAYFDGMKDYVPWLLRPLGYLYVRHLVNSRHIVTFSQLIDEMFAAMRTGGIDDLIVDLRGNGGGDPRLGRQLLYHMALHAEPRDFATKVKLSSLYQQQFPSIYHDLVNAYRARYGSDPPPSGIVAQDSLVTNGTRYDGRPSGFFADVEDPRSATFIPPIPADQRFRGRLHVLVNGETESAAMEFATIVSDNGFGEIVGNPTGGRPDGPTTMSLVTLPNSHERISVAMTISARPTRAKSDDVALIPTQLVSQRVADLFTPSDTQLSWLLDRIARMPPARPPDD